MPSKYKVQQKQTDGTMVDLPLMATYDSSGNKITETYVPKVSGKGLSTNDYTTTEKTKLSKAVTTDGTETITGDKTTTGVLKIQNGSASGAFVLGADSQAKTLTTNNRKLGRMGIPSYDSNGNKTVAGISFDAQASTNYADFGGHPLNSSSIAPDVIRFVVADTHNNTANGARTLALQISKQNNLVDSVSSSVPKSFAGAEFFVPVKVGGNLSATSITENGTTLANKYVAQVSGKGLSTNDFTTDEKTNLGKAVLTDSTQTITGAKTFNANVTMSSGKNVTFDYTSTQKDAGGIKWKASNSKNPYIGYCTTSTDGTFMVGSLAGTTYTTGLCIGGSSGNLLWKGSKVVTASDTATTSTAGLMSASDKTKLNGLSNYTLPTASSSTLGGVKTGSNITNSSGTISVSKTNVTNALGYTPASPTDLENKADVYKITAGAVSDNFEEGTPLTVGMDMGGKTLVFNTNASYNTGHWDAGYYILRFSSGAYISTGGPPDLYFSTIGGYLATYTGTWNYTTYTLPSDIGTITQLGPSGGSTYTDVNTFIRLASVGSTVVDCEYNYKNKADVYTASGLKFNGLSSVNQTFPNNTDNKTVIGIIDNGNTGIISTNADSWDTRIYYSDNLSALNLTTLLFEDGVVNNVGFAFGGSTIVWDDTKLSNTYWDATTIAVFKNAFVVSGGAIVDCEYNYKEIQALKEQVKNASNGGVYLHSVTVSLQNSMFDVLLYITNSSSTKITTGQQLVDYYGQWSVVPCAFNGGSGYDAGYIAVNGANSFTTNSIRAGYSLSSMPVNSITDTVKQV